MGNSLHTLQTVLSRFGTRRHTQLGRIQHLKDIRSIALSPDDRFLAIGAEDGKFTIENLRDILPASCFAVSILYFQIK
jgi:hypothetical protein